MLASTIVSHEKLYELVYFSLIPFLKILKIGDDCFPLDISQCMKSGHVLCYWVGRNMEWLRTFHGKYFYQEIQ